MSYPVLAEFWTLFEGSLQIQAKRLVEDIAKQQQADPKVLWAKVKPQMKIGLCDVDLPEDKPLYCSHPYGGAVDGAVKLRCRGPCLIGFDACPKHVGTPHPTQSSAPAENIVDRVYDSKGLVYFVDKHKVARDRNGIARGYVEDDILVLFEVGTASEALNKQETEE